MGPKNKNKFRTSVENIFKLIETGNRRIFRGVMNIHKNCELIKNIL